jgi:NAD-dependent deacetylase
MGDQERQGRIARAAEMIDAARRVVVFTGAGVSTESGIPDFRSPGGLWTRFDPEDFTIDRYLASPEARRKHWRFLREGGLGREVQPNAAHRAIAALHALGKLDCVVTQNIDNLHQKRAVRRRVYESTGTWARPLLACGRASPSRRSGTCGEGRRRRLLRTLRGALKPDVTSSGALPEATLRGRWRRPRCGT